MNWQLYDIQKVVRATSENKTNEEIANELGCLQSKVSKLKNTASKLGLLTKNGRRLEVNALGYLLLNEKYEYSLLITTLEAILTGEYYTDETKTMAIALAVWRLSSEAKYSTVSVRDLYRETKIDSTVKYLKKLEAAECYAYTKIADLHNVTVAHYITLETIVDRVIAYHS